MSDQPADPTPASAIRAPDHGRQHHAPGGLPLPGRRRVHRRRGRRRSAGPTATGTAGASSARPAGTSSTAEGDSPAVFFATPASIRCPAADGPPKMASAA
jgi:hypothetical protein